MPREGVPYPERMLCSLKCELKNIWNALNGKLHSVNGVEGDGQGNVNIVSGNAAVVVTPQPLSNQVEISLDQSQLPAAAVSSVNGETGAVVLDASEIPYNDPDGYTDDVDEKLNVLTGVQNALQLSINQERTRAQNAEGTLQTNINTVTASLPGAAAAAAAAAVAADSTIVRTSGNQNIVDIKTVATQATGNYSQQIANSQKVRNEIGNLAVLTTGNQTVAGIKTFSAGLFTEGNSNNKRLEIKSNQIEYNVTPGSTENSPLLTFSDKNGAWLSYLFVQKRITGKIAVVLWVRNTDGTNKQITLIEADN